MITKLKITEVDFPELFTTDQPGANVTIVVKDGKEVASATLKSRGITQDDSKLKISSTGLIVDGNNINFLIPASYFDDPLGLYSWFSLTDKSGYEVDMEPQFIYLDYPQTSTAHLIPDLKHGKKGNSIPNDLSPPRIKFKKYRRWSLRT